jgi:hypothetical protein
MSDDKIYSDKIKLSRIRDSSVGIAIGYRLRRPRSRNSSPSRVKNFLHVVQTGSGVHPASYPIGIGALSLGVKRAGREAYHSPPTSSEVKKTRVYTSTLPYVFMA